MTYLCEPYPQGDGSRFQWSNCGCAAATELIDMGSGGALRIPASTIRATTGDVSGGIEGSIIAAAANELTGRTRVELVSRRATSRQEVKAVLEQASIGIIIDCSVTVRTKYRTNFFTGLHWVTVAAGTHRSSDNTVKVEDPGTTLAGWKRWPMKLLLDAAEAVNNGFWILEGPKTEDCDRKVLSRTPVRDLPSRDGKRVRRLAKGEIVHVKRSLTGGSWITQTGSAAYGWFEVRGGYVKGESLGLK
jgi:hypothetical protein